MSYRESRANMAAPRKAKLIPNLVLAPAVTTLELGALLEDEDEPEPELEPLEEEPPVVPDDEELLSLLGEPVARVIPSVTEAVKAAELVTVLRVEAALLLLSVADGLAEEL